MTNPAAKKCVCVMGATATGKSELGIELALKFGGEIVSMDSRQVYRGMNIGTGKVTPRQMALVPHHLIDALDPDQPNSAGSHAERAEDVMADITARGKIPFLVGGTGLYFEAVFSPMIDLSIADGRLEAIRESFKPMATNELYRELERVDPARAAELSENDRVRITRALEVFEATGMRQSAHFETQQKERRDYSFFKIVLTLPRKLLRERIARRTRLMFESGWIDEVRGLLAAGYSVDVPGMNSLGYPDIARALTAGEDPDAIIDGVITRTHQYAKRQETFFRRYADSVWYDVTAADYAAAVESAVAAFLRPE